MSLFSNNKFPKVGALKDQTEASTEAINAANAELQAAGISAFLVPVTADYADATALASAITAGEEAQSDLVTVTADLEKVTKEKETLESDNQKLTKERDDLSEKLTEATGKPSAGGATPDLPKSAGEAEKPENGEFWSEADEAFMKSKNELQSIKY